MGRVIDLTGKRFGKLTAISFSHKDRHHKAHWLCSCDCGNETVCPSATLRKGTCKSCGCLQRKRASTANFKHGKSKTRLYNVWSSMKGRCHNKNHQDYPNYGGRGVKVCKRWRKSFQGFIDDMGKPPSPKHTIERIDVDGDYCPENCTWATRRTQANNSRNNRRIEFDGETHTLAEWARKLDIPYGRLLARLRRGWTVDRAFSQP